MIGTMTGLTLVVLLSTIGITLAAAQVSTTPAIACPSPSSRADTTDISLQITGSGVEGNASRNSQQTTPTSGCGGLGTYRYEPLCGKGQTGGVCAVAAQCGRNGTTNRVFYTPPGGVEEDHGLQCLEDGVATPAITRTIVLRALKRITLPEPKMIVQPPGGRTLVNFDTLFHTEADTINRTIRLLGKRIELEITPASFTWHHGDETTQTSTTPGIEYEPDLPMDSYISHQYADAHVTVHPSVDVNYTARFRVGRGPWLAVDGNVTRAGPPVDLRIIEGRTVLLGG